MLILTNDTELITEFLNEVENRIPSVSTYTLNVEFWTFCAAQNIPPNYREIIAESLITGKQAKLPPNIVPKYHNLLNTPFFSSNIENIRMAAAEKERIDILRKSINQVDAEAVKKKFLGRLKELLLELASLSPFTVMKINNVLDEWIRLGFSKVEIQTYAWASISEDWLANNDPEIRVMIKNIRI